MKLDDDPIKIPMYDRDCRTELLEKVKEIFATKSRKIDEAKEKKRQEAEAKKNLEKKAQDLKFSYQVWRERERERERQRQRQRRDYQRIKER